MKIGTSTILQHNGSFLAIECKHGRGITFPGGQVDPGETVVGGAIRELCEETGIAVDHHHLQPVCSCVNYDPKKEIEYFIYFFYCTLPCESWMFAAEERVLKGNGGKVLLATEHRLMESTFAAPYSVVFSELRRRGIIE